jgi:hypothetical protein
MGLDECEKEKGHSLQQCQEAFWDSSGTESNGPTSENDADFCAVIFSKT